MRHDDLVGMDPISETGSMLDEAEVLERQRLEGAAPSSAKTAQLIKFLQATEEGVKSLVFSQVSCGFMGWAERVLIAVCRS